MGGINHLKWVVYDIAIPTLPQIPSGKIHQKNHPIPGQPRLGAACCFLGPPSDRRTSSAFGLKEARAIGPRQGGDLKLVEGNPRKK